MTAVAIPLVAQKIGEGYERSDAELPLDINYQKVIDFLVSRQKMPNDWHKRLQAIQAKAADAVKEPAAAAAVSELQLGGPNVPLDYFVCVQLRDKLAASGDRSLFGGLTGAASTFDKVVKAYEKGLVYAGEVMLSLIQNVDYDIPFLKKQAAKFSQQVTDAERKQVEFVKNAAACAVSFKQECSKMGISGQSVRSELAGLSRELPALFAQLVSLAQAPAIADACQYYADYTRYAHPTTANCGGEPAEGQSDEAAPVGFLCTLDEVLNGRTAAPTSTSRTGGGTGGGTSGMVGSIDWDLDMGAGETMTSAAAGAAEVCWDIEPVSDQDIGGGAATAAPVGISWDLGDADVSAGDATAAPIDISWDITDVEVPPADGGAGAAPPPELCWDISTEAATANSAVEEGQVGAADINWDIDVAEEGVDAATAPSTAPQGDSATTSLTAAGRTAAAAAAAAGSAGNASVEGDRVATAALRLEHDAEYRAALLDDLQELNAFLVVRQSELSSTGSEALASVLPEAIQAVDASAVASMLAAVATALATATSPRMRQLLLIASSRRYLDRLVNDLERRAGQEAKLAAAARESAKRGQESRAALADVGPKVMSLIRRSQQLKDAVERLLSPHLGGRRVNILGEINNVLASAV